MLSDAGTVIDYLIILINKDIYAFDCQAVVLKSMQIKTFICFYTHYLYIYDSCWIIFLIFNWNVSLAYFMNIRISLKLEIFLCSFKLIFKTLIFKNAISNEYPFSYCTL